MPLARLFVAVYSLAFGGWCQWQRHAQCSACTVQMNGDFRSDLSLDEIVERALRKKEDDKVTLQFPVPRATTTPAAAGRLMRPRLGQNVSFSCQGPLGVPSVAISWTHQGRTVFEQGQPVPMSNRRYDFLQFDDSIVVLRILNVSLPSTGEVVCHLQEATRRTVLHRYTLIPLVTRAAEVFAAPLAPQYRVTVGDSYNISCAVRLPLAPDVQNVRHHHMWRHKGHLINVPREEPYTSHLPSGWVGTVASGSELIPLQDEGLEFELISSSARLIASGPVECWFRPHRHLHEWIVQSTVLVVKEKA
ncbi:uncharacterized protein LOC129600494 [Paramacrobiotus metropolitanus]|uniref:uncharacterized protein LOC129600494 n=1 Tax=Paramacrobiotus metropolitanus TaxID=2943436 RepID=UPI00244580E6|nr:uncharacterized protein LOC129600494 [Paramacrobiotus metropolitanus]XP_055355016.1 uncharacterized protein LOC129600494 [Paramacrobiotus metropolitanus]